MTSVRNFSRVFHELLGAQTCCTALPPDNWQARPSEPSPLSLAPISCPGEPPGTHQAVFPNVPPCLCLAFNISWNLLVEYVSASYGSHSSHKVLPFWWVRWLLHRLSCPYSTLTLSLSRDGCRPHRILISLWEISCVVAVLLPVYEQGQNEPACPVGKHSAQDKVRVTDPSESSPFCTVPERGNSYRKYS